MSHLAPRLLPLERVGARSGRLDLAISITAPEDRTDSDRSILLDLVSLRSGNHDGDLAQ